MRHVSDILRPIVERAGASLEATPGPFRRTPVFVAEGAHVLDRRTRQWLTVGEAERAMVALATELATADDPGLVLPLVSQLAWAIRDAREGAPPLPPVAEAA